MPNLTNFAQFVLIFLMLIKKFRVQRKAAFTFDSAVSKPDLKNLIIPSFTYQKNHCDFETFLVIL